MQGKQKRVISLHWLVKLAAITAYDSQASSPARLSLYSPSGPPAQYQPLLSSPLRLLNADAGADDATHRHDSPCVTLARVTLVGRDALPSWVPLQRLADNVVGQCLGVRGITHLMTRLQNKIIHHGWVTTRLVAPPQDLSSGILTLRIIPGRVRQLRLAPGSQAGVNLNTALPGGRGDVLCLRAIEQAVDNLQRSSTVQASIALRPGPAPGESDIVIHRQQSRLWQCGAWFDNAGSHLAGRYRTGLLLALENPAALSDRLLLTLSREVGLRDRQQAVGITGHYSVPVGYWLLGVTARDQRSHQWIACQRQHYRYSGHQRSVNLQLAWVVHRNGQTKTTAFGDWQVSDSDARLNHVILRPQTRRTSTWRLGVSHRREHPRGTLDLAVDYRRGTRWGNACAADQRLNRSAGKDRTRASVRPSARHREEERELMAGPDALTLSARASSAFTLAKQTFTLTTGYQYQTRTAPQTVNDTFAADGGWALRGMDASVALFARRGWLLHHTLAWHRALATQDLYLSLDYGEMRGGADTGKPRWLRLAGAAVGVRGHLPRANLSYDVFAGLPLTTSAAGAAPVFLGFRLSWQY